MRCHIYSPMPYYKVFFFFFLILKEFNLRHRCREQTYGHQGGKAVRGGVGGEMNWEIRIDIYTLICIKWITNKNLLYKKIK